MIEKKTDLTESSHTDKDFNKTDRLTSWACMKSNSTSEYHLERHQVSFVITSRYGASEISTFFLT